MNKGDVNQKKLMRACGFKIDHEANGFRIWGRGELRIALEPGRCPSLMRLVSLIINQTIYRANKYSFIIHKEFPTK
jgi:hypothetical protein